MLDLAIRPARDVASGGSRGKAIEGFEPALSHQGGSNDTGGTGRKSEIDLRARSGCWTPILLEEGHLRSASQDLGRAPEASAGRYAVCPPEVYLKESLIEGNCSGLPRKRVV